MTLRQEFEKLHENLPMVERLFTTNDKNYIIWLENKIIQPIPMDYKKQLDYLKENMNFFDPISIYDEQQEEKYWKMKISKLGFINNGTKLYCNTDVDLECAKEIFSKLNIDLIDYHIDKNNTFGYYIFNHKGVRVDLGFSRKNFDYFPNTKITFNLSYKLNSVEIMKDIAEHIGGWLRENDPDEPYYVENKNKINN
jgi:hypothetical protein